MRWNVSYTKPKHMDKLRIYFEEDESDDYMNETEINGMDVILC